MVSARSEKWPFSHFLERNPICVMLMIALSSASHPAQRSELNARSFRFVLRHNDKRNPWLSIGRGTHPKPPRALGLDILALGMKASELASTTGAGCRPK